MGRRRWRRLLRGRVSARSQRGVQVDGTRENLQLMEESWARRGRRRWEEGGGRRESCSQRLGSRFSRFAVATTGFFSCSFRAWCSKLKGSAFAIPRLVLQGPQLVRTNEGPRKAVQKRTPVPLLRPVAPDFWAELEIRKESATLRKRVRRRAHKSESGQQTEDVPMRVSFEAASRAEIQREGAVDTRLDNTTQQLGSPASEISRNGAEQKRCRRVRTARARRIGGGSSLEKFRMH